MPILELGIVGLQIRIVKIASEIIDNNTDAADRLEKIFCWIWS